ncbi:hypothetical protein [Blastococcus goldschmidtiae]|uniref:Uncharacterized protein n=1 Tax=Blastococcus goldschmidtiae TaxID=3075546 RepID=A0ABU2KAD2_9ACTN|nr:hypothetical protein [Blastococcus sp. DSM 46792]MDT0277150.1 hypothetical protein [Blastococcus sp. DSM 46792]
MTEPHPQRPVPGPPRHTPGPDGSPESARPIASGEHAASAAEDPFADLDQRPVAEHVAVYEAEHGRLQRELGTIDQL